MRQRSEASYYFAYGSNMQRDTFLRRRALKPLSWSIGRIVGWELCFDLPIGSAERGVANLRANPEAETWGLLWQIGPRDFERLDRSEGVPSGLYKHQAVQVHLPDGGVVSDARTYVSERRAEGRKPSSRYLGLLLEGAKESGIPEPWVQYLESIELAWDERPGAENPPGLKPRLARG